MKYTTINFLILLFLSLLSLSMAQGCGEVCHELTYSDCDACIRDCDDAEGYKFISCKQRYCAHYETEYYYSNG